jgi:RNA polymerase sigma-70 factor, ECF subfamily
MTSEDDEALVRRTLAGDNRAFEQLIDAYQTCLFNVALRILGNSEDARDVVQTAFIKAYCKLDTYDPQHRFFSWIYRIARNESLNLLKRRRPPGELDETIPAPGRDPRGRIEELVVSRVIQEALMRLSMEHRQVVVLRYYADLSHREIGEAMGIPEKTVKSRLFAARKLLGRFLLGRSAVEA